jgi:hypothetical protein
MNVPEVINFENARKFYLNSLTISLTIEFEIARNQFARVGSSPELEICLPILGIQPEECKIIIDEPFPPATLAPGTATTFEIYCSLPNLGLISANLSIASNDSDEFLFLSKTPT